MTAHHMGSYRSVQPNDVPTGDSPRQRWERSTMNDPDRYEIRLKGHLAARWAAWFDDMTLTPDTDGTTVLQGPVADQAALYGLLNKLRDTGLPLLSVTRVHSHRPTRPADAAHPGD